MSYINDLRNALKQVLDSNPNTLILGEDLLDPFGGCFKVTRGFTEKYPNRIINTPISEAGFMGVAIGLSLSGYIPIVEVMFYDFMTLCMDQLLNHACSFPKIWDVKVPMLIRTVVGKPSYGITHSKNLDYIFCNILEVFHPSVDDVFSGFINAFDFAKKEGVPVLFVEESNWY